MLSNSSSECWFMSRLWNVIKFSITRCEAFSSSWWLINSTKDKSNCQLSWPLELTHNSFSFWRRLTHWLHISVQLSPWNSTEYSKQWKVVRLNSSSTLRMLPEEARVYALSISAAFHNFTHTHSPQSTPDVCCQICSPHTELKKIRGVAKRQTSFTPVQINLIQSEDSAWDSLPSPSSFDESATASLINYHQRCVLDRLFLSFFFSSLSWLWLMAQALSLCHKRK